MIATYSIGTEHLTVHFFFFLCGETDIASGVGWSKRGNSIMQCVVCKNDQGFGGSNLNVDSKRGKTVNSTYRAEEVNK